MRRSCPLCERRTAAREAHFALLETADDDDRARVDLIGRGQKYRSTIFSAVRAARA